MLSANIHKIWNLKNAEGKRQEIRSYLFSFNILLCERAKKRLKRDVSIFKQPKEKNVFLKQKNAFFVFKKNMVFHPFFQKQFLTFSKHHSFKIMELCKIKFYAEIPL